MIATLVQNIKTTLNTLVGSGKPIQAVYSYPETSLTGFPSAIFFLTDYLNNFDSNEENSKEVRFSIFILCELKVGGISNVYESVMPGLIDTVVAKFDDTWNQGATVSGNRVWWNLSSGSWVRVEVQQETVLQAELILTVKYNNSI